MFYWMIIQIMCLQFAKLNSNKKNREEVIPNQFGAFN